MEKHICLSGKKYYLTDKQAAAIVEAIQKLSGNQDKVELCQVPAGEVVRIGDHEMIVLEQSGDTTALIRKDLLPTKEMFGSCNNFDGSYVDGVCKKFAEEIASTVGEENLVEHTVDLISDDGLKDYGKIRRRASLLTADLYRRYVELLDKFKPDSWWWLATPFSTKRHDNDLWVKCVSPSGFIYFGLYYDDVIGVRPFCILNSSIFVSR